MNTISAVEREADVRDFEKLCSLVSAQMKVIGSEKSTEDVRIAVKNALAPGNRSVFFIYRVNDEPIAFAFGNICTGLESGSDYFWLNELYVEDYYRRSRIATELIQYMENWTRENRIGYISCVTGKGNTAAQNFFVQRGYDLNTTIWVDKTVKKRKQDK